MKPNTYLCIFWIMAGVSFGYWIPTIQNSIGVVTQEERRQINELMVGRSYIVDSGEHDTLREAELLYKREDGELLFSVHTAGTGFYKVLRVKQVKAPVPDCKTGPVPEAVPIPQELERKRPIGRIKNA